MNIKEIKKEALLARICATRQIMGEDAAQAAAESINQLLKEKEEINILFAAAPSQNEFLAALQKYALPWNRIHALHMDEYIGLQADAPQRFGNYLKEHIFAALPFKSIHYLYIEGASPENICAHYEEVLQKHPIDIVFMGIGENGHIAFNDPHVALFDDPQQVKVVLLDEVCRTQQVHDGWFLQSGESTPTGSHHYDTGYDESYPYLLHSTGKAEGECCERNIIRPCQHHLPGFYFTYSSPCDALL